MTITDQTKYRRFFINTLSANVLQYDNEYKRVIAENGDSEEIKQEFYLAAFKSIMTGYKENLPKNQNYKNTITHCYNSFIKLLKEDNIKPTAVQDDLTTFLTKEFPKVNYIPDYKEYNPNTKYGRKKALEQANRNYANGTPQYQNDSDSIKIVLWIIVIIVAVILYFINEKLTT